MQWILNRSSLSREPVRGKQSVSSAAPLNISRLGNRCMWTAAWEAQEQSSALEESIRPPGRAAQLRLHRSTDLFPPTEPGGSREAARCCNSHLSIMSVHRTCTSKQSIYPWGKPQLWKSLFDRLRPVALQSKTPRLETRRRAALVLSVSPEQLYSLLPLAVSTSTNLRLHVSHASDREA